MTRAHLFRGPCAWLGALALCVPASGLAQTPDGPTPEDVTTKVKAGQTIFITDRNGVETEAWVVNSLPDRLTERVMGQERVVPRHRAD